MKFNLTEAQKQLLRHILRLRSEGHIADEFEANLSFTGGCVVYADAYPPSHVNPTSAPDSQAHAKEITEGSPTNFQALIDADCLVQVHQDKTIGSDGRRYAIRGLAYRAVESNFADDQPQAQPSTFTNYFHGPMHNTQIGNHNHINIKNTFK